jgi:hypothetical protein
MTTKQLTAQLNLALRYGLTQERLKNLLDYNPYTGIFRWRVTRRNQTAREGNIAGTETLGYWSTKIDGQRYRAHQLAWFYETGEWATKLDHRDNDKLNNRFKNLRLCTRRQNRCNAKTNSNNTSGQKGVYKRVDRWGASIVVDGKNKWLGTFETFEGASNARTQAADEEYGEFARH